MPDSTAQLRLDLGALETLVTELAQVLGSLDSLDDTTGEIAGEVGVPDLAARVVEFSQSWAVHRLEIENNVKALADELAKIVDGVEKTDQGLASALTNPGAP